MSIDRVIEIINSPEPLKFVKHDIPLEKPLSNFERRHQLMSAKQNPKEKDRARK